MCAITVATEMCRYFTWVDSDLGLSMWTSVNNARRRGWCSGSRMNGKMWWKKERNASCSFPFLLHRLPPEAHFPGKPITLILFSCLLPACCALCLLHLLCSLHDFMSATEQNTSYLLIPCLGVLGGSLVSREVHKDIFWPGWITTKMVCCPFLTLSVLKWTHH